MLSTGQKSVKINDSVLFWITKPLTAHTYQAHTTDKKFGNKSLGATVGTHPCDRSSKLSR